MNIEKIHKIHAPNIQGCCYEEKTSACGRIVDHRAVGYSSPGPGRGGQAARTVGFIVLGGGEGGGGSGAQDWNPY